MIKKFFHSIIFTTIVFFFSGCGGNISVPDINNVEEETAKEILTSNTLIPIVEYEFSDEVEKGNVIYTKPEMNTSVQKNSKVVMFVSEGAAFISSKESTIHWYHVSGQEDNWEFMNPYIENGVLKIECTPTFAAPISWKDPQNYGKIVGDASIADTYDKKVPVRARYLKKDWDAYETQNFTLEISLADLDVKKPTTLYVDLIAYVNGVEQLINCSFSISW